MLFNKLLNHMSLFGTFPLNFPVFFLLKIRPRLFHDPVQCLECPVEPPLTFGFYLLVFVQLQQLPGAFCLYLCLLLILSADKKPPKFFMKPFPVCFACILSLLISCYLCIFFLSSKAFYLMLCCLSSVTSRRL